MNNPFRQQAYPNLGESFGIMGWILLASILVGMPIGFIQYFTPVTKVSESIFGLIGYTLPFAIVSFFIYKKMKTLDNNFSLKFNLPSIGILLLLIPLTLALSIVIEPFITVIPMPDFMKELFESMMKNDIYSVIMVAVMAPIFEEIIFRGFILNGLLKNYSPTKAILWSATLFGIVHLNPWQFIGAFIIGAVIGWLYWKTNSIIPGMLIHFVNNFSASMVMIYADDANATTQQLFGGENSYYIAYTTSALIVITSFFFLKKYFEKKQTIKDKLTTA